MGQGRLGSSGGGILLEMVNGQLFWVVVEAECRWTRIIQTCSALGTMNMEGEGPLFVSDIWQLSQFSSCSDLPENAEELMQGAESFKSIHYKFSCSTCPP